MILRLALLTCAFYLAIAILIEVASLILARLLGGFAISTKPWGWALIFGFMWLISFTLAWHVFRAKYFPISSNFHP